METGTDTNMIERLLAFSIHRRTLIFAAAALLAAAGLFSLKRLAVDAVPDVTNVQVQILTSSPSLAPVEVERLITYPVETALQGLPKVADIRSVSQFGLSVVTVVFQDDVDIYFARQLVQERLSAAAADIPPELGRPAMAPISTALGEVYQYLIEGDGHSLMDRKVAQEWIVRPQLLKIPGVVEVNTFGGFEKQYQVLVDPRQVLNHSLTLREILDAVSRNNANAGGGLLEQGSEQYLVRSTGFAKSVNDLQDIVVKTVNGTPVYVKDVAEVTVGPAPRQGVVTVDGKEESVAGIVMLLKDANARSVVRNVKKKISQVAKSLPEGMRIVPFYDRSELVDLTLRTVRNNLVEGGCLVIVVLLILLGNWRGSLIVASVIPLSMLFAFGAMHVLGIAASLMSLGAIDFGLIVDSSVIQVENIVRRLSGKRSNNFLETVRQAALEVRKPAIFGEIIILVTYLPILTLTGMEGRLFRPMAMTVMLAIAGAVILSLTFVPAACAMLLKGRVKKESETRLIQWLAPRYRRCLDVVLTRPKLTVGAAAGLVAVSLSIFSTLGREFMPQLDEGAILVQPLRLTGVSVTESARIAMLVEKKILEFPEVKRVVSRTGRPDLATDPMPITLGDVYVLLKSRKEWETAKTREDLVEKMEHALTSSIPGVGFSFTQPIQMRVNEMVSGVRSDIAIKLFGDNLELLEEKAGSIARAITGIQGAQDVRVEQVAGLPQITIRPNRKNLARYGVNVADLNEIVEVAFAGKKAGQILEGEARFDVVVRLAEEERSSIRKIKGLLVATPSGARVPLGELADVSVEEGPAQISREFGKRRINIECNIRGRDVGTFVEEARARIERDVPLPAGYFLQWGGVFEHLERAQARLVFVVPLALALIFMLLYMSTGSVRLCLLIFTGIPFAVVGGVLSLWLRDLPFTISAGVGFVALFGVSVLNGLVMVSHIRNLAVEGSSMDDAVRNGAEDRLRPVLMTALVASLGFIPMALSHGVGAEIQRPLATVVIGGIMTSTLLTLIVLPVLYGWFGRGLENEQAKSPHSSEKRAA